MLTFVYTVLIILIGNAIEVMTISKSPNLKDLKFDQGIPCPNPARGHLTTARPRPGHFKLATRRFLRALQNLCLKQIIDHQSSFVSDAKLVPGIMFSTKIHLDSNLHYNRHYNS